MNEPLLSICIPTYRQPEAFRRLLDSLVPQLTSEVEVVIRDDSPENTTEHIVAEYRERGVPLRYFHGERQGLDGAILFLTAEARGRYVWWFGDDLLEYGAISKILSFLREHPHVSFVYLSSRQTTDYVEGVTTKVPKKFPNGDAVLEEYSDMLGFITATILERAKAISGLATARSYQGTAWVNLFLVLHVLAQSGEKYSITEPLIISEPRDPDIPSWYDGFTVFAINFLHILNAFRGSFSRLSIRRAVSENFCGIWKGIVVYRAEGRMHGLRSKSVTISVIARHYWSYFQFWIALPFLVMPRGVLKFAYAWYKKIRG